VFQANLTEIYKSSKSTHLRAIAKKTKADLKDMIFFDNDYSNCQTVAKLGETSSYVSLLFTKIKFAFSL
jgi:hypothetical protein